jgi:HPt (histidine-containing phosphotransfer) domain-containing protein
MDAYSIAGAESPATDASALERLQRFGGGTLLQKMIGLFLTAAPERIQGTRGACERGDAAAAELALHSLKSSAAQLGAVRLQRLSERGEQLARVGSLDGLTEVLRQLEDELVRVEDWLVRARDEVTT